MNLLLYDDEIPERIDDNKQVTQPEVVKEEKEVKEKKYISYNYIGKIQIDKINLNRGFLDINSPYNNVSRNVTVIEKSSYPDVENGNLILAAHSGSSQVAYFDDLNKLSNGDNVYVYYKNIKYIYKITNNYSEKKTGSIVIKKDSDESVIVLTSCSKSNTKQLVYIGKLIGKESYSE